MLEHLDGLDRQLDALDRDLEQIAVGERWAATVQVLTRFKGISTRSALGLIAEIGDFSRFAHPRELAAWLGIVPSEYSSGAQRHRGHIAKTGNHHARRLLVEAAWAYRHPPKTRDRGPETAELGLERASPSAPPLQGPHRPRQALPVATVAIARELSGFLWAAVTDQPLRRETATA